MFTDKQEYCAGLERSAYAINDDTRIVLSYLIEKRKAWAMGQLEHCVHDTDKAYYRGLLAGLSQIDADIMNKFKEEE